MGAGQPTYDDFARFATALNNSTSEVEDDGAYLEVRRVSSSSDGGGGGSGGGGNPTCALAANSGGVEATYELADNGGAADATYELAGAGNVGADAAQELAGNGDGAPQPPPRKNSIRSQAHTGAAPGASDDGAADDSTYADTSTLQTGIYDDAKVRRLSSSSLDQDSNNPDNLAVSATYDDIGPASNGLYDEVAEDGTHVGAQHRAFEPPAQPESLYEEMQTVGRG